MPIKKDDSNILIIILIMVVVIIIIGAFALFVFLAGAGFLNTNDDSAETAQASISDISARWRHLNSHDLAASEGNLYLWITFILTNHEDSDLSVFAIYFKLYGDDGSYYTTIEMWGPSGVNAGGSANFTIFFEVPENWSPKTLCFYDYTGLIASEIVPMPASLREDVILSDIHAYWNDTDLRGNWWPSPDERFLFVSFTMKNDWEKNIESGIFYFRLQGIDNQNEYPYDDDGPDELSSGATAEIILVFLVPTNWQPDVLYYDMYFGPNTSVIVPEPD